MFNFDGMTVAITGAANGIGKGCAKVFAKAGATVVLLDMNTEKGAEVVKEIEADGGKAVFMQLDITNEENVQEVFACIKDELGQIDTLINSAGIISLEKYPEHDGKSWDKVINVDLKGTYLCMRAVALIMREQKTGSIINISAGAAKTGGLNVSPSYVAAKGGVNSLTLNFANQLSSYGVRVNAICPGPIDTAMIDLQANLNGEGGNGKENIIAQVPLGLGTPEDIAYAAMYLAHPLTGRYVTGEILDVNGGLIKD